MWPAVVMAGLLGFCVGEIVGMFTASVRYRREMGVWIELLKRVREEIGVEGDR